MTRTFADLGLAVVVVDSSGEIAGDGDEPHACIGNAVRLQVGAAGALGKSPGPPPFSGATAPLGYGVQHIGCPSCSPSLLICLLPCPARPLR